MASDNNLTTLKVYTEIRYNRSAHNVVLFFTGLNKITITHVP